MAKLEKVFIYNGVQFTPIDSTTVKSTGRRIVAYKSNEDSVCLICDENDNILFEISADCSQNLGFLRINSI